MRNAQFLKDHLAEGLVGFAQAFSQGVRTDRKGKECIVDLEIVGQRSAIGHAEKEIEKEIAQNKRKAERFLRDGKLQAYGQLITEAELLAVRVGS